VKLTIRHLSGSRAGEEQVFEDPSEITIGRSPSSMILFDPDRDRVVSGKHASITPEGDRVVFRDLGSSNGSFADGAKITERVLRPGEVIQLGRNGPKIQIDFAAAEEVAPTVVVPLDDIRQQVQAQQAQQAQAPREGKTVIMMMPGGGGAAAPSPAPVAGAAPVAPAYVPPKKKKGGLGRALAIVAAVMMVLLIGLVGIAVVVRNANLKKRKQVAAQKPTATQKATPQAQAEAAQLNAQIQQQQQNIARTQETLARAQTSPTTTGGNSGEVEDLKRQLAESQAMLEQMTRQLQERNDQVQAQAQKPEVRYVQVPATSGTKSTPPAKSTTAPVVLSTGTTSKPVGLTTPSSGTTTTPAEPQLRLVSTKKLKKKVLITPLPAEVAPANLPSGTPRDLANLLAAALVSTGDYVVGPKGQASVNVSVTDYRADIQKGVDTKKTADNARKIGRMFGQKVPSNPVDVRSVSYDAAMAVNVRVYDGTGRLIAEVQPRSASSDRKSKVGISGVSFHDIAFSDTAVGDVARRVIGDAVDTVRGGLSNLDWTTFVAGQGKDKLTLGTGRNANLEPGDVFEIVDGKKSLAKVRVISVTETTADAEFITAVPKDKLANKLARYLGSETQSNVRALDKSLVVRIKTSAFEGPGDSFREIKELRVGSRMKLLYSVGSWAKASDGSNTFWVPLAKVQIEG
jgi:hypothetical protein